MLFSHRKLMRKKGRWKEPFWSKAALGARLATLAVNALAVNAARRAVKVTLVMDGASFAMSASNVKGLRGLGVARPE